MINKRSKTFLKYCIVLFSAITMLCLTGCAGETQESQQISVESSESSKEVVELMQTEWKQPVESQKDGTKWNIVAFQQGFLPKVTGKALGMNWWSADSSCIYVLSEYYTLGSQRTGMNDSEYYLTKVQTETFESESQKLTFEFSAEDVGLEEAIKNNQAYIAGMDVSAGKVCLFIQTWDEETVHCYVTTVNEQGNFSGTVDVLPAIKKGGFHMEENLLLQGLYCDDEGRVYFCGGDFSAVYIADKSGELLYVLNPKGQKGAVLSYAGKLPDGIPMYEYYDRQEDIFRIICFDGTERKELFRGDGTVAGIKTGNGYGEVFCATSQHILKWNIKKGISQVIHREAGNSGYELLTMNSGGELIAVKSDRGEEYICKLTDAPAGETVELVLEAVTPGLSQYIEKCVLEYNKSHPGVEIRLVQSKVGVEERLPQLVTELAAEKGPDMMVVRRPELIKLQDAGALAVLDGRLSEEIMEQVYPAVLENGKVDDELYGITCEATLRTLFVSKDIWKEDGWTLRDVLKLIEAKRATGQPYEMFTVNGSDSVWPGVFLKFMAMSDMENSPFADMQNMTCSFNSDEFGELLKLGKEYVKGPSDYTYVSDEEYKEMLLDGKGLAYIAEGNLTELSNAFALLGENYHPVGFPVEEGSGHFLDFYDGSVVVSKSAKQGEIIDDFLKYLLSYEMQRKFAMNWVRKDVLQDNVSEKVDLYGEGKPKVFFMVSNGAIMQLEGKEDGSSFLPEFLELMEQGVADSDEWQDILNIATEELDAVIAGDRNAESAAEIVQNRVQLYLDERK